MMTDETTTDAVSGEPVSEEPASSDDATTKAAPAKGASPVRKTAAKNPVRRPAASTPVKAPRQVTLSVRSIVASVVLIALVVALGVFLVRDISARKDLNDLRADVADRAAAENVAGKYAVNAATLDYRDLTPWIANMKKGVSPDLQKQYDLIGQTMDQVLTPLRMQTTADLIVAKTVSTSGDIFRVQAVVDVNTKSVQTPNGSNTTATYTLTLDRSKDWMITSVGDPTSAIPQAIGGTTTTPTPSSVAPSPAPASTPAGG